MRNFRGAAEVADFVAAPTDAEGQELFYQILTIDFNGTTDTFYGNPDSGSGDQGSTANTRETIARWMEHSAGLLEMPVHIDWTSGTSGQPKGVVMWNKCLTSMLFWHLSQLPAMDLDDGVLGANLFGIWYWFYPLAVGLRTVIIPDEHLRDHEQLIMYFAQKKITRWDCTTPTLLQAVVQYGRSFADEEEGRAFADVVRTLKVVVVSGEALKLDLVKLLLEALPNTRVFNLLSTTETGDVTCVEIDAKVVAGMETQALRNAPIGGPLWNVKCYLAKKDGEFCVGGVGLFNGEYFKDKDNTADYFKEEESGFFWHSKDLCEVQTFGGGEMLTFMSRMNCFVKIRGHKVDLEDIEQVAKSFSQEAGKTLTFAGRLGSQNAKVECTITDAKVLLDSEEDLGMIVQLTPATTDSAGLIGDGRLFPVLLNDHSGYAKAFNEQTLRSFLRRVAGGTSLTPKCIVYVWRFPQSAAQAKTDHKGCCRLLEISVGHKSEILSVYRMEEEVISGDGFVFVNAADGASDLALPGFHRSLHADSVSVTPLESNDSRWNANFKRVCKCWTELLNISIDEASSVMDDATFFDLGGTSLQIALLAKRLGLRVMDVWGKSSLTEMTQLLCTSEEDKDSSMATTHFDPSSAPALPNKLFLADSAVGRQTLAGAVWNDTALVSQYMRRLLGKRQVAVVGMAVRFPGTQTAFDCSHLDAVWRRFFGGDCSGVEAAKETGRVTMGYTLPEASVRNFDCKAFGIPWRKAVNMDPNHRMWLEMCFEALVDGGAVSPKHPKTPQRVTSQQPNGVSSHAHIANSNVGVFAATSSLPTYLTEVLYGGQYAGLAHDRAHNGTKYWEMEVGSDKDYIATTAAFHLDLHGPAKNIQTACSSGLAAIAEGVDAIRAGACDAALCGAMSCFFPQNVGHEHVAGMVWSADGYCRSFDKGASGTVNANGGACVLLKPLEQCTAADRVYGVITGVGVNNDGHRKRSFDAPSMEGQTEAIAAALADQEISRETTTGSQHMDVKMDAVSYVECHGTATQLGDPIEIAALQNSHGKSGPLDIPLTIGSSKANIGHANTAAGAIGLMKMCMQLHKKQITPICHFSEKNPLIEHMSGSRMLVFPTKAKPWALPTGGSLKRVGAVSSFGIGGTNVHLILEEAADVQEAPAAQAMPTPAASAKPTPTPMLLLSASSKSGLEEARAAFLHGLKSGEFTLQNATYTLQFARPHLACRLGFSNVDQLANNRVRGPVDPSASVNMVYLFPGQGSQHAEMGRFFVASPSRWPIFHECLKKIERLVRKIHIQGQQQQQYAGPVAPSNVGLRKFLEAPSADNETTQLAIFSLEVCLAETMQRQFELRPAFVVGHSLGEFAAAVVSGLLSLEEATTLVQYRGSLLDREARREQKKELLADVGHIDKCGMMGINCSWAALEALCSESELLASIGLACNNAPQRCSVGGCRSALAALKTYLEDKGVSANILRTSTAFHTAAVDPLLSDMEKRLQAVFAARHIVGPAGDPGQTPIRMISTLTGAEILPGDMNADYWKRQMRQQVRFVEAIRACSAAANGKTASKTTNGWTNVFVEVGPTEVLSKLSRMISSQDTAAGVRALSIPMLPHANEAPDIHNADDSFLSKLTQLWAEGVLSSSGFHRDWTYAELGRYFPARIRSLPFALWDRSEEVWPSKTTDSIPQGAVAVATPNGGTKKHSSLKQLLMEESRRRLDAPITPPSENHVFYEFGFDLDSTSAEHLCRPQDVFDMEHSTQLHAAILPLGDGCEVKGFVGPGWANTAVCASVDEWVQQGPRWIVVDKGVDSGQVASPRNQIERLKTLITCFQKLQEVAIREDSELWFIFEGELNSAPCVAFIRAARKEADFPVFVIVLEGDLEEPLLQHQLSLEMVAKSDREVLLRIEDVSGGSRRVTRALPTIRPSKALNEASNNLCVFDQQSLKRLPCNWVVITGGSSGVGLEIAKWCVFSGVGNILLVSRNKLPAQTTVESLVADSLAMWGARQFSSTPPNIISLQLDISLEDGDHVQSEIIETVARHAGSRASIVGIFHCAGVVSDSIVKNCQPTEEWLRPKVSAKLFGAQNMLQLYDRCLVDQQSSAAETPFLLMCSSSSSTLGPKGQSVYCFANRFQDAICQDFIARKHSTTPKPRVFAVQWGGWHIGMTATHGIQEIAGEKFLSEKQGISAMARLIASDNSNGASRETLIMDVADWRLYWKEVTRCVDGSLEPGFACVVGAVYDAFGEPATTTATDLLESDQTPETDIYSDTVVLALAFPRLGTQLSYTRWQEAGIAYLAEHTFENKPLVPGTFFIELFVKAAETLVELAGSVNDRRDSAGGLGKLTLQAVEFKSALELENWRTVAEPGLIVRSQPDRHDPSLFHLSVCDADDETDEFATCVFNSRLSTQSTGAEGPAAHTQAELDAFLSSHAVSIVMQSRCASAGPELIHPTATPANLYSRFSSSGFEYGHKFRRVIALGVFGSADGYSVTHGQVLANPLQHCSLVESAASLDACTQVASLLHPAGILGVPRSIQEVCILRARKREDKTTRTLVVDVAENKAVKSAFHGNAVDLVVRTAASTIVMEGYDMVRFGGPRSVGSFVVEQNMQPVTLRALGEGTEKGFKDHRSNLSEKAIPTKSCFRVVPLAGSNALAADVVPCLAPTFPNVQDIESDRSARKHAEAATGVTMIVRTEAWGLNFLDVLLAKGVIDLGPLVNWGGEFVGFVEAMYESLEGGGKKYVLECPRTGLKVGDRVASCSDGRSSWGEFAESSSLIASKIPETVAADQAVSVNLAYCTAYLALIEKGRVAANESILIHSAAGGVGLACVNLAKWKKMSPIYGTCSTEDKVRFLMEQMGLTACFNSRDVDEFSGEILSRGGVDVVVNSLAGPAMIKSIAVCNTRGKARFLEVGKRDQFENTAIPAMLFANAVSYHSAHLDVLMDHYPEDVGRITGDIWKLLLAGKLEFLPTKVFALDQASEALQHLSTGKHIGKVVVLNRRNQLAGRAAGNSFVPPAEQPALHVIAGSSCYSNIPCLEAVVIPTVEELARKSRSSSVELLERFQVPLRGDCFAAESSLLLVGSRIETREMIEMAAGSGAGDVKVLILPPTVGEHEHCTGLEVLQEVQKVQIAAPIVELCDPWEMQIPAQIAEALCTAPPQQFLHVLGSQIHYAPSNPSRKCEQAELSMFFARAGVSSPGVSSGFESEEAVRTFLLEFIGVAEADKSLDEYGFDSLSALNLRGAFLRAGFPKHLMPGAFFEEERVKHMTIEELGKHLNSTLVRHRGRSTEDSRLAVDGPPRPKAKKILCLHGFRTNASIMELQLVDIMSDFDGDAEFFFPEAPHVASGPGDDTLNLVERDELREWWYCPSVGQRGELPYLTSWNVDGGCVGAAESIEFLHTFVQDQMGGEVDLVIGFSQGAAMGKLLLMDYPLPSRESEIVKGAVFFSAVRYHGHSLHAEETARFAAAGLEPDGDGSKTGIVHDIVVVHCFDLEDEFVHDTEELMDDIKTECPGVAQETVLHREGHTVPRAKASSQEAYDVVRTRIAELLGMTR
jgi:acyl transferase domain-containing protein/acyl-CoA synthetase (AMP-forming)/AMP-acid ligase II